VRPGQGRGLVIGKFMPPHRGHVHLIDFARAYADAVVVVVESVAGEPIPSALRFAWMREIAHGCRVHHLTTHQPQEPSAHPDFWGLWRRTLAAIVPDGVDYVFASEAYGAPLAGILGAHFVPVDPGRHAVPVSASQIRADPMTHWDALPPCVRPYFAKRVCVFGPESTGKSTLAQGLAAHFETVAVPEYARAHLEARDAVMSAADMPLIARGQMAAEDALARQANRLLICDTDPLTTAIWSEALYGQCAPEVTEAANARRYHLTLLLDVDVPWIEDPVRYLPENRRAFFDRCEAELIRRDRPYVIIRGHWDARWETAVEAVAALLE
jgi:HTH-type transcriptional repressor of NAD biosynthesis genes